MYKIIENQLAIGATQKCGSRTILGYVMLLRDPDTFYKNPNWFSSRGIYNYSRFLDREIFISVKNIVKLNYPIVVAIVRDPFSRFISSYSNRMRFYTGTQPHSVEDFIEVYDKIEDIVPNKQIMDYSDKMLSYADVKFHISPLCKRYGNNSKIFTHIFNINQMERVRELIENVSKTKLPDLKLNETYDFEKSILTEYQKQWIFEKYKEDIEVYGKWM